MNRAFFIILLFYIFSSCDNADESIEKSGLSISMDTVRVNSDGKILDLNFSLVNSSLDPSSNILYNFNSRENALEKINLVTLRLDSLIKLPMEGPNGIARYSSNFIATENKGFIFSNSTNLKELDSTAQVIKELRVGKEQFLIDLLSPESGNILRTGEFSNDGKLLAGLYGEEGAQIKSQGLIWLDLTNKKGKLIPTKELDFIYENNVLLKSGNKIGSGNTSSVFFEPNQEYIFFSTSSQNSVFLYDLRKDSLIVKQLKSKLSRDKQTPTETITVEDFNAYFRLLDEKRKEVTFGPWKLDPETGNRWRFTREFDKIAGEDSLVFKTILTGIDKNLEMLGETELPQGFYFPYKFWVRKGMIYTFLNEEDELAFIRLKPTFTHE